MNDINKKNIALVIGASKESIFAIKTAQELGLYVIAFDGNPKAEGLKYANESFVMDINNSNNIIKILRDKNIVPQIILPVPIGRCLTSIGKINSYYDLIGPREKETDICTDKYLFHIILQKANLRNIDCFNVKKQENIMFSKPVINCIIKPRFGSGSRNVSVISNKNDYDKQVVQQMPFNEDMIIETLVEGTEYGVDGAVINGQYQHVLLREKINTEFPYRQCIGYYSVFNKDLICKVTKYLQEIISVLQLQNCLLHTDLIYNNNEFFVIELSPRPSGHNLHNHFTILATGVNMVEQYINFVVGKKYNFKCTYKRNLLMRFYDFENCIIKQIPDFEQCKQKMKIIDYKCNINNERLTTVKDGNSIINRGYFILEDECRENLKNNSSIILNLFKKESIHD